MDVNIQVTGTGTLLTLTRFLVCQQSGSWGTGAVESPRRVVTEIRTAMCNVSTLIYVCKDCHKRNKIV